MSRVSRKSHSMTHSCSTDPVPPSYSNHLFRLDRELRFFIYSTHPRQVFTRLKGQETNFIMGRLEGIMALTYTPLKEDYSLNEDAVRREIDWVIQSPLLIHRVASSTTGSKMDHSGIGYLKARFSLMSGIDMGPPCHPTAQLQRRRLKKQRKEFSCWRR